MERSHTALSVVAILGVLGTADPAFAARAQAEPKLRFTVRIDDKAGVPGALLKFAEERAADVFAMRDVKVEWIDGADANRLKIVAAYTVLIMAEAPASLKAAMEHIGVDVMGQGAPLVGRAYIYYDRVLKLGPIPPRDVVTTLGDVLAHELGHLMLPAGHSNVGIMRPSIDMSSRRLETFTTIEATQLREQLRRHIAAEIR